jgi:hypothetical protein
MRSGADSSRREFLAYASLFGWIPFLRPHRVSLAGAHFRIIYNGRSNRHYLLIHGDEESARKVVLYHIQAHQGVAFVVQGHTRDVPVAGGKIDPNRMFTGVGAAASLHSLNPDWGQDQIDQAVRVLDAGREKLIKALFPRPGGILMALHNNSAEYSVADEQPLSDAASIREPANPHAFFLCTDENDFRVLSGSPYNVVLQNKPKRDDGSLSVVAARSHVRYLNLEVALGNPDRQNEMLMWAEWNLP